MPCVATPYCLLAEIPSPDLRDGCVIKTELDYVNSTTYSNVADMTLTFTTLEINCTSLGIYPLTSSVLGPTYGAQSFEGTNTDWYTSNPSSPGFSFSLYEGDTPADALAAWNGSGAGSRAKPLAYAVVFDPFAFSGSGSITYYLCHDVDEEAQADAADFFEFLFAGSTSYSWTPTPFTDTYLVELIRSGPQWEIWIDSVFTGDTIPVDVASGTLCPEEGTYRVLSGYQLSITAGSCAFSPYE